MWSRIYLIPALTAEEDRDLARRYYADQAREKQLLGGNTSPYNSDKYETIIQTTKDAHGTSTNEIPDTFVQLSPLPQQHASRREACRGRERVVELYICNEARNQQVPFHVPFESTSCIAQKQLGSNGLAIFGLNS